MYNVLQHMYNVLQLTTAVSPLENKPHIRCNVTAFCVSLWKGRIVCVVLTRARWRGASFWMLLMHQLRLTSMPHIHLLRLTSPSHLALAAPIAHRMRSPVGVAKHYQHLIIISMVICITVLGQISEKNSTTVTDQSQDLVRTHGQGFGDATVHLF